MRVHVVLAHPLPSSFAAAVHRQIVDGLQARGHQVDDLDLYAERFDPVMTLAEREAHYRVGSNLAGVERYVERLRAAEALVYVSQRGGTACQLFSKDGSIACGSPALP